ncbi:ferric reduction oxidase 4-like [Primulina huaijiensis]|uniref:ferric reduction oxidase 4-like n=1 Tax=Primulina huaijiensis TaxID=1492673 RepID=UPI003CC73F0C
MKFQASWQMFFLVVFVGYIFMWTMLPTKLYHNSWTPKLEESLNSTYFREQGTNLLLFSFPIMLIAVLGCVYLHLMKKSNYQSNRSSLHPLRRPALVMAPLGIVNAVELTFAAMFVALLIWSLANYLHISFGHIHMYMIPGEKVWQEKFRSISLRLGYIGNTCWAFLFFPVARGSSLLPLFGLTSESSIKYHIWLGHISNTLFAAHAIGYIIFWAMTDQMILMLEWSSTYLSNVAGVIAFVVSLGMWVTSFDRVRRKAFEVFFYSHHLYTIFMFFYMLHVGVAYMCLILPGIFLFLIDRYLRFLQSRHKSRLVSTRLLPNGTLELTFAKNPDLSYSPASILFVRVPSICKLQWHPFTMISNSNLEPHTLSIAIKSEGSWTQKLYKQLSSSSSSDRLEVSTEGPYGPASFNFLRHESLVMISGGSGIAPFISMIREIIHLTTTKSTIRAPNILLVSAFKNTTDLTILDILLPFSGTSLNLSELQLQIEAYVTRENKKPLEDSKKQIETKLFKPNPMDAPISPILGKNSWLCLATIISSSFVLFLITLGLVTRYHIYPVERRGENYHYSFKILWYMFLVCVCIFVAASVVLLWQKRKISAEGKQIQNFQYTKPTMSPASWLCGVDTELESLPHQSLVQSTKVHFGARPDLKRMLLECKGSDVGVLVCGPKSMRHEVARICASGSAKNLHFESISFSW